MPIINTLIIVSPKSVNDLIAGKSADLNTSFQSRKVSSFQEMAAYIKGNNSDNVAKLESPVNIVCIFSTLFYIDLVWENAFNINNKKAETFVSTFFIY